MSYYSGIFQRIPESEPAEPLEKKEKQDSLIIPHCCESPTGEPESVKQISLRYLKVYILARRNGSNNDNNNSMSLLKCYNINTLVVL